MAPVPSVCVRRRVWMVAEAEKIAPQMAMAAPVVSARLVVPDRERWSDSMTTTPAKPMATALQR